MCVLFCLFVCCAKQFIVPNTDTSHLFKVIYILREPMEHLLGSTALQASNWFRFIFLMWVCFLGAKTLAFILHIVYILSFSGSAGAVICFLSQERYVTLLDSISKLPGFPEEKLPDVVHEISHLQTILITLSISLKQHSKWNCSLKVLHSLIAWTSLMLLSSINNA